MQDIKNLPNKYIFYYGKNTAYYSKDVGIR